MRALHVAVKLVIVLVMMVILSPLAMGIFAGAHAIAGGLGVFVAVGLSLWPLAWFLFTQPAAAGSRPGVGAASPLVSTYCTGCGVAYASHPERCLACARPLTDQTPETVETVAGFLNYVSRTRELLDPAVFTGVVRAYEERLRWLRSRSEATEERVHPSPAPVPETGQPIVALASTLPVASPVVPPQPAVISREPVPPVSARRPATPAAAPASEPPGPTVGDMGRAVVGWAAERQADILLYVGAFLLSVAAIIFVAYRGDAVGPNTRFGILTGYALGFLALGLALHRWERVKEAGPVFLALGAVLLPIDFVMLRTVFSQDELGTDVLTFWGGLTSAVLYVLLAVRGYGRWYVVPAAPAALLAWGALGAIANLPIEWFGAWFEALAVPAYLVAQARRHASHPVIFVLGLAVAVGAGALAWSHIGMVEGDHAAVPAAYAIATAGLSAGLVIRRDIGAMAVLPPLGSMTLATEWWAAFGLAPEWQAVFVGVAGAGYLLVAHFDSEQRAAAWAAIAGTFGSASIAFAHAGVQAEGADRAVLPASYGLASLGAAGAFARWRWASAAAMVPPLGALTALTASWAAAGLAVEWYGLFSTTAGAGYIALGYFRPVKERLGWQTAATLASVLGLAVVHAAIGADVGATRWALPLTYAAVTALGAAAFLLWRWSWRVPPAALPALAATTAAGSLWAGWQLQPEWYGVFAALAGAGYLVVAHSDVPRLARSWAVPAAAAGALALAIPHALLGDSGVTADPAALPAAYSLVFLGTLGAFLRWRWMEAGTLLPPLAAMAALTAWWGAFGLGVEWYGAFAAAATLGYLALAYFDRPERIHAWRAGALGAGALALGLAHASVADQSASQAALPATYGIVLGAAGIAFAVWRYDWRMAPGLLPPLAAMTALTTTWAEWDLPTYWYAPFLAAIPAGYLPSAFADRNYWPRTWLGLAMLAGVVGLGVGHANQVEAAADHAALPIVYAELFVPAAIAVARFRLRYREVVATLPALGAGLGASFAWAAFDMRPDWLGAWVATAAAGYLAVAWVDAGRRPDWRYASFIIGVGSVGIAHAVALAEEPVPWQLPSTYAVLFASWSVYAARWRDVTVLLPPILGSVLGAAVLWAAGPGPEWWPFPALGIAALMMAASLWWRTHAVLGASGWAYAAALAGGATLTFLPVHYAHPEHGLAAQLAAAGVLTTVAFGSGGAIARLIANQDNGATRRGEWTVLIQAAFAFLFGAGASLNAAADITGADRAWVFTALAFAGWLLTALPFDRARSFWTFAPVGLAGMTLASFVAAESPATLTAVLELATAAPLVAFAGAGRWTLLGVANTFLLLAIWAFWQWQEWNTAYLPLAFATLAAAEWAALTGVRHYTRSPGERGFAIAYLSWGPWVVAAVVAGLLLNQKQDELATGESLVNTEEWGLAAAVLAMASASVFGEGLRVASRWTWIAGSFGLLVALLMAIATREPENVQWYWAPVGVYLIAVALTFRESPEFIQDHMYFHEAVTIAGALCLVLPPAEQSFEPGGGKFGLELIGIGVAMLLVGLVFHGRWLVPAAILTLTGVSIRLVTGGLVSAPYWLLLGVAGTMLIAFGLLVLLERERWDQFRRDVVEWWNEAQPGGHGGPHGGRPAHA
jgi:hypothetical protein